MSIVNLIADIIRLELLWNRIYLWSKYESGTKIAAYVW